MVLVDVSRSVEGPGTNARGRRKTIRGSVLDSGASLGTTGASNCKRNFQTLRSWPSESGARASQASMHVA